MDVISHTGIPKELLSDQGSMFMARVTTQLCQLQNIKKLNTTAYHPQTRRRDGMAASKACSSFWKVAPGPEGLQHLSYMYQVRSFHELE